MHRRFAAVAVLLLLLIGCSRSAKAPAAPPTKTGGAPESGAPATPNAESPHPAPAWDPGPANNPAPAIPGPGTAPSTGPAPSPAPAPPDPQALVGLCKGAFEPASAPPSGLASALLQRVGDTPPDQLAGLFAPESPAPCVRLDYTKPGQPGLLTATIIGGDQGAILWWKGDRWVADATESLAEYPEILRLEQRDGLRELFVAARMSGTGGFGSLRVFRQDGDRWRPVLKTKDYDHFSVRVLDGDNVLITARNPGDVPLAWAANCCIPTDYQWLWQRSGAQFVQMAERRAPDPYYTLNLFFGALQQKKSQELGDLANPTAVTAAQTLKLDQPDIMTDPEVSDLFAVTDAELKHWSALPPAFSGPAPVLTTLQVKVRVEGGEVAAVLVDLRRNESDWVVEKVAAP